MALKILPMYLIILGIIAACVGIGLSICAIRFILQSYQRTQRIPVNTNVLLNAAYVNGGEPETGRMHSNDEPTGSFVHSSSGPSGLRALPTIFSPVQYETIRYPTQNRNISYYGRIGTYQPFSGPGEVPSTQSNTDSSSPPLVPAQETTGSLAA